MRLVVEVPNYEPTAGVRTVWDDGFEITVKVRERQAVLVANAPGLRSLARHLLALAADGVPVGAHIHLDGETATIAGVDKLKGAPVMATDLRASVSLVIAALAAEGETMVNRVYHLDRGFERLEDKLSACGASIQRISD